MKKLIISLITIGLFLFVGCQLQPQPKEYLQVLSDPFIEAETFLAWEYIEKQQEMLGAAGMPPSNFKTTLAERLSSGVATDADDTISVSSLTTADDHTLVNADIGDRIFLKINPNGGTKEIISCDKILTTTTAFTDCIRGYQFYDETASTTLVKYHSAGETIIASNDMHYLKAEYAALDDDDTIEGHWTFATNPVKSGSLTPTTTDQYVTKAYADSLTISGAATSTEYDNDAKLGGLVYMATTTDMASTTYNLNNPRALHTRLSTSSPSEDEVVGNSKHYLAVSQETGFLSVEWMPTSTQWNFAEFTVASSTLATTTITVLDFAGTTTGNVLFNGGNADRHHTHNDEIQYIPFIPGGQASSTAYTVNEEIVGAGIFLQDGEEDYVTAHFYIPTEKRISKLSVIWISNTTGNLNYQASSSIATDFSSGWDNGSDNSAVFANGTGKIKNFSDLPTTTIDTIATSSGMAELIFVRMATEAADTINGANVHMQGLRLELRNN